MYQVSYRYLAGRSRGARASHAHAAGGRRARAPGRATDSTAGCDARRDARGRSPGRGPRRPSPTGARAEIMAELWGVPNAIPCGTAHLLTQHYPPLDGDPPVPEGWFRDEQRWKAVAAEYREVGFVVVRQLLSGAELAHLRGAVEDYIRDTVPTKDRAHVFLPEDGDLSTLQYFSSPHEHPYLDSFPQHPRWRHLAAACLGEPFGDETEGSISGKGRPQIQYFNKVPGHSLPTPAHQDNFYFKLDPVRIQCIVSRTPAAVFHGLRTRGTQLMSRRV